MQCCLLYIVSCVYMYVYNNYYTVFNLFQLMQYLHVDEVTNESFILLY